MKKNVSTAIVALSVTLMCPLSTFAQWDYGQDSTYNSAEARIDARKTRDRIRARQGKHRKSNGRTSTPYRNKRKASTKVVKSASTSIKKVAAPLPHHDISIHRDTFQDFHLDDANGYTVTFNFTPVAGKAKPIAKTYNYNYMKYRHAAEYNDIPTGTYTVKASAVYNGRRYPVHLATEEGTSSDSKGGDFSPSIQLVVKPAKDNYGDMVIQGFPNTIYSRIIE